MKYKWAVYNKLGALVGRTLTLSKAQEVALKFGGIFKRELYRELEKARNYYGNDGR